MGMTKLVRHELRFRTLQVTRVTRLTPRMVRVTFGGSELAGFVTLSPDDHVKVFFPAAGEERPVAPILGPQGIAWPEGAPRPVARDYTPRRYDAAAGELDIDFLLHGGADAAAAAWAACARPGQWVGIAGPRGSHIAKYDADWYLLAGDQSALPSLARRLEDLPAAAQAVALLEVASKEEILSLRLPARAEVIWLPCDEALSSREEAADAISLLEAVVRRREFPEGVYQAWVQGEAGTVRAIYRHLLYERGAERECVHANGYWKRGVANHDHHEPIEA